MKVTDSQMLSNIPIDSVTRGHVYLRKVSEYVAETPFTNANGKDGTINIAPSNVDQNNPYNWQIVERNGSIDIAGEGIGTLQNHSISIPSWYKSELKLKVIFKDKLTNVYGGLEV